MGKNIVVFSDGTGQKGGVGSNTNVYKLFNMVEDRTDKQIAFYDPGLGTDWRKITGLIAGQGFSKNILDCYSFIFENYEADDEIYLFGFSRGAATVRSLSGFIHLFGILPKSRADLISEAFAIYMIKNKKRRIEKSKVFIEKHSNMWCKIKFLGVWDTVSALGLPLKGFSGVHTDVGGGYNEEDLSNISLKWMLREATSKNLRIYEKSPAYIKLLDTNPDVNGMMHNEQKKFPGTLLKRMKRSWNKTTHGEPCIHESVFERTKNTNNEDKPLYSPWIFEVMDKKNPCKEPWIK